MTSLLLIDSSKHRLYTFPWPDFVLTRDLAAQVVIQGPRRSLDKHIEFYMQLEQGQNRTKLWGLRSMKKVRTLLKQFSMEMSFKCDQCGLILESIYQLKVHALYFHTKQNQGLLRMQFLFIRSYQCDQKFESGDVCVFVPEAPAANIPNGWKAAKGK